MTPVTLFGLGAGQLVPVLLGGTAALTALYVLKQRRRRVEVPFSRLWQRVLRETESTSLWQHLRRWLSLLLQVLLLGLLVLALGDPRLGQSAEGRTVVLLIDRSASMQARLADGRTRLDAARDEARRLIREQAGDDLAVVVALGAQPTPMGGLSHDERELQAQVDAVTADDTAADLSGGLRLCGDLLLGRRNPQVVLVSDGGFDEAALTAAPQDLLRDGASGARLDLRYVPVPARPSAADLGNVAITSFAVRRYRHNRMSYEVLLEVRSFLAPGATAGVASGAGVAPGAAAQTGEVTVELLQEGEVVDVQRLRLSPGGRVQRLYPNLSGAGAHLTARLRLASGARGNALPLDDQAYAVIPERRRQRLLLVTRGDLFLEGALLSASSAEESQLEVRKIAPAAYDAAEAARYDVVVFDAFTPEGPPAAHALYLSPSGPGSPFLITGTQPAPVVTDVAKDHPLLRWVTLKDLNVSRAAVFGLGPGDVAVASMLQRPLIVARERRGADGALRRTVAVGFDLRQSDLPLRVAFPVLLVNALDWFVGDEGSDVATFATGHTWRVPLRGTASAAARSALLTGPTAPGSAPMQIPVYEGVAQLYGERAGFYELTAGAGRVLLAANLADETESAAQVRPVLRVGPAPGVALAAPPSGRSAVKRVLWPYLLLVTLLLLGLEWHTYHRRWTV